ncbi:DUF262 domain-containing protein [Kytococcus sedentarius]|uniref:GmrSD restriction endonuclease domain-containing protein n=1 Tax=Kytococcus sedentarius TaxID=1276 RepID=UPI00384C81B6
MANKYKVTQTAIAQLLEDVRRDQIAIPELQRPFVWKSTQVRDLLDSLYKGYPVGYLITWQSVGAKLKGGTVAAHQQILIDGQQRITALRAAVAGLDVVDKRYRKVRIRIAFNPVTEEFATWTPVIGKNPAWVSDVSELFNATSMMGFLRRYFEANPEADENLVEHNLERLLAIKNAQIGVITLADDLDVETVSEIFIRINQRGVRLSSADFVMSKVATYGDLGRNLRKLIDYFAHLAVAPHAYEDIAGNDDDFAASPYLQAIEWMRHDTSDLYDPDYTDIIRVAGLVGFSRGKASSIVSELSGLDPETRKNDPERIPGAYKALEAALLRLVRKADYEEFLMSISSAGFITPSLANSKNALNFAYALFLRLRDDASVSHGERKRIVRRWFVMSMLTGRHSGSFETTWESDIRRIGQRGARAVLEQIEAEELSDAFWTARLPRTLDTRSVQSPAFKTFLAAQVKLKARGFLSRHVTVDDMIRESGDIHHVVPKDYLRKNGYPDPSQYNQVANFALTEGPVNRAISNHPPQEYLERVTRQAATGQLDLGEIVDADDLARNLEENALPADLAGVDASNYPEFLEHRRVLMAQMMRRYYEGL